MSAHWHSKHLVEMMQQHKSCYQSLPLSPCLRVCPNYAHASPRVTRGVCSVCCALWTWPLVFSPYLRAAVPGSAGLSLRWSRLPGRNMEDLPAVEPVKIYENTYRLEPADNEK